MSTTTNPSPHLTANALFGLAGGFKHGFKAVVTGGGSGIGLMATQALAQNGATVYITGRRKEKLEKVAELYSPKEGVGKIIPLQLDVTDKDAVLKVAEQVKKREGESGIHLLINNAGVACEKDTTSFSGKNVDFTDAEKLAEFLWKADPEAWEQTYRTNVTAQYFVSIAFLPLLSAGTKSTSGYCASIINTTSTSGIMKGSSGGQFAYSTSKSAFNHLTQMLATTFMELDAKVRVNAIAPAVFPSEMTAGKSGADQKTAREEMGERGKSYPAGRPGREEDVAAAVLYLAGPGGVFVNGQVVRLDGGNLLKQPTVMF
ncbi:NAD(P)-binding protein [Ascodesmis nigricans]|uniref:NAD(P)-binding protein n=1 Tax=Ascodesmis nigricans TaxID=341454 RepID=A0A4S2N2W2_9PEZI|nr:NAD(P)-binding protein [Ascodesmis nigricans]